MSKPLGQSSAATEPGAYSHRNVMFRGSWARMGKTQVHALISSGCQQSAIPVVLVHGLGLSHRYMMPTAERLALTHPVYVPDLPGFGLSEHPDQVLTVPGLADALLGWMDAIALRRSAFLGNSFGCQIIIDLASRHPGRVIKGVLQGPTTPATERTWLRQFVRWRQNAPYNPKSLGAVTWPEYRMSGYRRVLQTFHYSLRDRPEDKAPAVQAPMLVVRGELDPICRADWADDLWRLLPNGRLVVIPKQAHTLVYTASHDLTGVTEPFLREGT
ncbi:alpha/beta fold hydrolase [Marinivivus vitaminiproducens]|uniref:alpha/beta fold hydrolase n=1 Tax=Marinivivus vitaminiproducens TaxID=3035935 RepID=UPI00279B8F4B|nr:alpha/beta hydrolase [Geminicoccaceae bacterium SCSIO 64248]